MFILNVEGENMCPSCCRGIVILGAATVNRSTMPVGWHDSPKSVRKSYSIVAFWSLWRLYCWSVVASYVIVLSHCATLLLSYNDWRSSGDVVVKLLACGARGPWFDSRSRRYTISEIGHLLLRSRDNYGFNISI